jgi:hypothetical protein
LIARFILVTTCRTLYQKKGKKQGGKARTEGNLCGSDIKKCGFDRGCCIKGVF